MPFCYLRESANGNLLPKMANPCGGKAAANYTAALPPKENIVVLPPNAPDINRLRTHWQCAFRFGAGCDSICAGVDPCGERRVCYPHFGAFALWRDTASGGGGGMRIAEIYGGGRDNADVQQGIPPPCIHQNRPALRHAIHRNHYEIPKAPTMRFVATHFMSALFARANAPILVKSCIKCADIVYMSAPRAHRPRFWYLIVVAVNRMAQGVVGFGVCMAAVFLVEHPHYRARRRKSRRYAFRPRRRLPYLAKARMRQNADSKLAARRRDQRPRILNRNLPQTGTRIANVSAIY